VLGGFAQVNAMDACVGLHGLWLINVLGEAQLESFANSIPLMDAIAHEFGLEANEYGSNANG
jgi:hypothetical protein